MIARRLDAWVVRAQAAMAPRGKQRRLFLRAAAGVLASAPRARRFSSFIRSRFSRTRAWALKAILTFAKRGVVGRGSAIRYAARLAERVVLARALSARNSPFVSLSHFNKIFKVLDTLALSRLHDGISSLEWGAIATRAGKTNVFLSKNLFWWRHSYRARYRSARWLQRVLKLWFKLDFRG